MKKKKSNNNIVKFPTVVRDKPKRNYLRAKQVGACFAIVFTLFAVPMLNVLNTTDDPDQKRAIANFEESQEGTKQLRRLARKSSKTLYSVGRRANQLEQFQFGVLYGQYTIKRELNKISQVHLSQDADMMEVQDRGKFIKKHRKIWHVEFDSIELASENFDEGELTEEFTLFDDSEEVGLAIAKSRENGLVMIEIIEPDREQN